MSVLIKGMKMPEDCPQCPLSHWNKLDQLTGCELVRRYVPESESSYWQSDTRPEWCPLVGLPYHGRLIDAKSISEKIDNIWDGRPLSPLGCEILALIDKEPTVIEADRSEE